jgi:eukaryotic-like serine/threonine-protein kinase
VGWLSVDATPWAQVFIDGKEIDGTPIARYPLPPGKYRVRFKNPDAGREQTREVVVESGKSAALTVDLR